MSESAAAAWAAFAQAKSYADSLPHGRDVTSAQRETYFDAIEATIDARDAAVAAFVHAHDGMAFAAPTIPWPGTKAKPSFIVVHQDAHGWRISRFDGTIARPRGATGHGYRGSYAEAVRDAVRDDRADLDKSAGAMQETTMTDYALTPDVLPYVGYEIQSKGEYEATLAFLRAIRDNKHDDIIRRIQSASTTSNEYQGAMAALRGGLVRSIDGGGYTLTKYGRVYLGQRERPAARVGEMNERVGEMNEAAVSKPGKHGTLHLFLLRYKDKHDPASPTFEWRTWAYDSDHALDKFYDSDDQGWKVVSWERVQDSAQHRAARHTVGEMREAATKADAGPPYTIEHVNTLLGSRQHRKASPYAILEAAEGWAKEEASRVRKFVHINVLDRAGNVVATFAGGTGEKVPAGSLHEMRDDRAEFRVGDTVSVSAPHGEERGRIVGPSRQTGVVTLQIDFGGTVQPFRRDKEGNWRDPGGSKVRIAVSGGMRESSHGHVSAAQARAIGDRLGVDWRHVPFEEFQKGLGVELEHADITGGDLVKTAKIVLAHLAEADDYYARLDLVGLEPNEPSIGYPKRLSKPFYAIPRGERVRVRTKNPSGKPLEAFWLTLDQNMTHDQIARQTAQAAQPGMLIEVYSGDEKLTFRVTSGVSTGSRTPDVVLIEEKSTMREADPQGEMFIHDREAITDELDDWAQGPLFVQPPGYMAPIAEDAGVNLKALLKKYERLVALDKKGKGGGVEADRLAHEMGLEIDRLKEQVYNASNDQLDDYVAARTEWIES